MREIKFRAWDRVASIMWQVEDICFDDGHGNTFANPGLEHIEIQDRDSRSKICGCEIELMQYTGLKDRNGKEIYEGDILESSDTKWNIRRGAVVYENGEYRVHYTKGIFGPSVLPSLYVIGNIYENPELLEKQPMMT